MDINSLNNIISVDKLNYQANNQNIQGSEVNRPSFEQYLKNSLENVNELQIESERQSSLLATGQIENVHDVTIAGTKAKISLDLTMAVRNKVVEAYKEIMRMQV